MKSLIGKEFKAKEILKLIYLKQVTNYKELEAQLNMSRKTISKYLDEIDAILKPYDIRLIRKQNLGIYLNGNIGAMSKLLGSDETSAIPNTKNERWLYILVAFISHDTPITIQQLADTLFVSRSTLENDIKIVKEYLQKYDIHIVKSKQGMHINIDKKQKRALIGDIINNSWKESVFVQDEEGHLTMKGSWTSHLQELVNKEVLEKVHRSLNLFFEKSNLYFSDYECQSLMIHLIIVLDSLQRKQWENIEVEPISLSKESALLISILEEVFACKIPNEESKSIHLHVLSALRNEEEIKETQPFIEVHQIVTFLKEKLQISYTNDKALDGISIHLSSAMKRAHNGIHIYNPYTDEVKKMFPEAYEETIRLKKDIQDSYQITLNDDECAFIALHIETLLESDRILDTRLSALLVCNYGIGSSRLLEQRILKYFNQEINVKDVIPLHELKDRDVKEDIIISTVPLTFPNVPVVIVSPLLTNDEKSILTNQIHQIRESDGHAFFQVLDEDLIFHNKHMKNQDTLIQFIGTQLIHKGFANEGIIESAKKRENMSSTAFDGIAIPHSEMKFVKKSKVVIYINKRGIDYNDTKVNIVFFMALNQEVKDRVTSIYHFLTDIIDEPLIMKQLIDSKDAKEVIQILQDNHKKSRRGD